MTKLGTPLKWAFALYAISSLVSMAVMNVAAVVLLVALIWAKPIKDLKAEWKSASFQLYLCLSFMLTAACALSLLGGELFPLSYHGNFSKIFFFSDMAKVWYLFWPALLVVGLRRLSRQDRFFVFQCWIVAFMVLSAIGIAQFFTGWPRVRDIPGERWHFHATLFLGHHLSVASSFIFPFFVALDSIFLVKSRNKILLFSVAACLGLLTLYFTYSRMLWVALPIGLILWVVWILPRRWSIAGVTAILIGIVCLSQYPPIQTRILDKLGTSTRQELWEANLEFLKHRPLTGVGWRHNQELSGYYLMDKHPGEDVFSGHAHNNFIDMLGGTGVLGTLAWIAWCIGVIWILQKQQKKFPHSLDAIKASFLSPRGLMCAWLVFHLNGLTQVNFWDAKVQHQIAWVVAWSLL